MRSGSAASGHGPVPPGVPKCQANSFSVLEDPEGVGAPPLEDSDDESDDEDIDLKAFTCNVSPYKGEILGLDISTKTVYKVDGDEGTVVGKVEDFKLNEEGKLDEDSIVGLVIDDE